MAPFLFYNSIVLIFDIITDWYRIEMKNRKIKHGIETALAGLVYLVGSALLVLYLADRDPALVLSLGLDALSVLLFWAPLRWIFHDLLLNITRGKSFDYLGSEQHSAETDKILARLSLKGWGQYSIKLAALGIGITLSLLTNLSKPFFL